MDGADGGEVTRSRVLIALSADVQDLAGILRPHHDIVDADGPEWTDALGPGDVHAVIADVAAADTVLTALDALPTTVVRPEVLVILGDADPSVRLGLLQAGVAEYLLVPFAPEELLARVAGLVRTQRRARDLMERTQALAHANRQLERFAYTASHDLKEPLRAISGFSRLLNDRYAESLDETAITYLDFIVDGADRLGRMINALLGFSRMSVQPLVAEDVDLAALVTRILPEMAARREVSGATVLVEDELPTVRTDRALLTELLSHLIANAVTYPDESRPLTVSVSAERLPDRWHLRVSDTGCGIAEADQTRAFDMFTRLHTRAQHGGDGIGLAVVLMIAQRLGGAVELTSSKEDGTTVVVELPVAGPSVPAG